MKMLGFSLKEKHLGEHLRKEKYENFITFPNHHFHCYSEVFHLAFFFSSADILEKKRQNYFTLLRVSGRYNLAPAI